MTIPAGSDDTIELMLTPEQMLGLSQAAEAAAKERRVPAIASLSPVAAPMPVLEGLPMKHALRWHQRPLAKMAANTLMFVAFVWWSVSQLAGQPQGHPPVAVAAAGPIAVVHHPKPIAAPQPPPVQVVNPFDKTEIFQFPAGTSDDESREKVAAILLQRARERQSHWVRPRPENSLRTASLAPIRKSTGPGT